MGEIRVITHISDMRSLYMNKSADIRQFIIVLFLIISLQDSIDFNMVLSVDIVLLSVVMNSADKTFEPFLSAISVLALNIKSPYRTIKFSEAVDYLFLVVLYLFIVSINMDASLFLHDRMGFQEKRN